MPKGEHFRKLSQQDIDRIVELYVTPDENGFYRGITNVSKLFPVAPPSIRQVLIKKLGKLRTKQESRLHKSPSKPIKNLPPSGRVPLCKCGCRSRVEWNRRKNKWNVYVDGHYRTDALYKDADWLRREYQDNHRSVTDIAAQCGVWHTTVVKFMKKFNIPRRKQRETLAMNGKVRGPNNPAWKGGIAKWPYAHNWKRIARMIRKRDNYTCWVCKVQFPKSSKLLHVHHKDEDKFNNDPDNLVTVCATCHSHL